MENEIEIGVTTITNVIEVTAQPNDQIVDIGVTDNTDEVVINVTPSVIEININKGGLNSNLVTSVNNKIGDVILDKNDIGLNNVDNTADYDKMISLDTQIALNEKADLVDGVVPSYQLPSYVDDVLEFTNYISLPLVGEVGKIYVTLDNNKIYRWSGSIYIEIASNSAIWGAITGTLSNQLDLQNALNAKVPYTGATSNVNLGEFGIQLGNLEFDLTPTNVPTTVGSLSWNDSDGTLDLKLKGGNVTLQLGQETVARIVNKTATNITLLEANYQAVRVTGAQGQRPKVDLAQANNDLNSTTTLGLVTETILINEEGFITTSGQVQQINTTGSLQGETWTDGDILYLSGTIAGRITNIKPIAPIHTVIIGFVEYAHAINGKIFVKVDNGYELEELHNVSAIAPNNNEVLAYDSATTLWKPKTVITALGYTPANNLNVVPYIGATSDVNLGANSLIIGYVGNTNPSNIYVKGTTDTFISVETGGEKTSILSGGIKLNDIQNGGSLKLNLRPAGLITGVDRIINFPNANGTVALTSDLHNPITILGNANGLSLLTQELSLDLSSSTTNGALSSTDWNTFNNKLTLPTLTSGSVLFSNGTTIAQDNSQFFWDNTNKRLGIGTTTPVGKINVFTGLTGITEDVINQQLGSISFANGGSVTAAPSISGKSNNNLGLSLLAATNDINSEEDLGFNVRRNNNTDFTTLTSSAFRFSRFDQPLFDILRNGDTGIGTTTIGSKLQVNGNTALGYNASTIAPLNGLAVSGDVGIGTITPNFALVNRKVLDVNGVSTTVIALSIGGAQKGYLLQDATNLTISNRVATGGILLYTADVLRLTIASTGIATFTNSVISTQFRISALNTTPASATATGILGEIRYDANYMYVCVATNTWKRSAITTW